MWKTCEPYNYFNFWGIFIKFGGIVGEVKVMKQSDTGGAIYSFAKNMSKKSIVDKYMNLDHSFQDNFIKRSEHIRYVKSSFACDFGGASYIIM